LKNILFVLRNHFTNDSRVLKEATSLAKDGYKVTIRCLWDSDLPKVENTDQYTVERVCYSKRGLGGSKLKKIITFIKFLFKCLKNINNFDVIHCHDLDGLIIGAAGKMLRFGNVKIVYDAHEYEAERVGLSGAQRKIFYFIEFLVIKFADEVICVSDSIANEYVKNYKIDKPKLILNCPKSISKLGEYDYFREKFNLKKNQVIFLYQGMLGPSRGVELLINAFTKVKDKNKVIVFMGYGSLYSKIEEACEVTDNVYLHEAVKPDVLLNYTCSADVGLVLIENTCLSYYYCLPNKLFEYTQANLPVIVSDLPELRAIVENYENGVVVKRDSSAIALAVDNFSLDNINQFKKNIPEMKRKYNWEQQELVLLDLYKSF